MLTHRKRLRRYEVLGHVRFLTVSCVHRLPLFNNAQIKDAFADQIALVRRQSGCHLFGWVIMPEHVHLLLMPDHSSCDVPEILWQLKKPFAQHVIDRWRELDADILKRIEDARRKPHFWQAGGGYDRNIVTPEEFTEKLNYIHNNPVTRGLVEHPTDWKWSSALWYAGHHDESLLQIDAMSVKNAR